MIKQPVLKVYKNRTELYQNAANMFIEIANAAIEKKEKFTVCLSGGKTPRPLYELLATPEYAEQINWKKVHVFFGDERMVPPEDEESNFGMIKDLLLRHVNIPKSNIYPIDGTRTPREAMQEYIKTFQEFYGAKKPFFDLALLGMGKDGHIASMFPNSDAIKIVRKRVKDVYMGKKKPWRITVTSAVFNRSKNVILLVSGKRKSKMVQTVLHGEYDPVNIPAQILRKATGNVTWLLDEGAAYLIKD